MQLVAYGMQDVYLTGNAQITFFKHLYRRHTNFSVEAVEQTFQSNSTSFGNRMVAVISRNGDLLHRLWLEVNLKQEEDYNSGANSSSDKNGVGYVNDLGHALIKSAEVEIGGQKIDQTYGRFQHLWHKLSCKGEKEIGYDIMSGNGGDDRDVTTLSAGAENDRVMEKNFSKARKLFIPINFFFSKGNAGAALPLIALQYHEVRVTIELADRSDILRAFNGDKAKDTVGYQKLSSESHIASMVDQPKLFSDFFYLDTDERKRFSQMSHEYLIEQLQFTGSEVTRELSNNAVTPFTMRLNFNHPTKAIYWTAEDSALNEQIPHPFYNGHKTARANIPMVHTKVSAGEYEDLATNCPIDKVGLNLNGHERFTVRDGEYFWLCQPYQHHTRIPYDHWLGMYSFCLSPEEFQPSGALNFSRIDNASLKLDFKKAEEGGRHRTVYVYAVNYNVLRILSGMGGLAFSN